MPSILTIIINKILTSLSQRNQIKLEKEKGSLSFVLPYLSGFLNKTIFFHLISINIL